MPSPRKVDLLPTELRDWLRSELERRGFGDYEQLADDLNARLSAEGVSLTIQKSAIHAFGQEHRQFTKLQEEASAWAEEWFTSEGLEGEAKRHGVLFNMLSALAFKFMRGQMAEGKDIDPKELHFVGRMMKDLMASSGMREKLLEEERKGQIVALDTAVEKGELDEDAARAAKKVMGLDA